jgi:hypothetical protein
MDIHCVAYILLNTFPIRKPFVRRVTQRHATRVPACLRGGPTLRWRSTAEGQGGVDGGQIRGVGVGGGGASPTVKEGRGQ